MFFSCKRQMIPYPLLLWCSIYHRSLWYYLDCLSSRLENPCLFSSLIRTHFIPLIILVLPSAFPCSVVSFWDWRTACELENIFIVQRLLFKCWLEGVFCGALHFPYFLIFFLIWLLKVNHHFFYKCSHWTQWNCPCSGSSSLRARSVFISLGLFSSTQLRIFYTCHHWVLSSILPFSLLLCEISCSSLSEPLFVLLWATWYQ